MPIEAKVTVDVKLPDLDFTKELQDIAENVILPDIRYGINRSVGIDQQPFPALEPSTLKQKAARRNSSKKSGGVLKAGLAGARGGSQQLVDTGELRDNSMSAERVKQNHVKIGFSASREKVAFILQEVGVGHKKKKFNFFGISQRAEFQAIAKIQSALKAALERIN